MTALSIVIPSRPVWSSESVTPAAVIWGLALLLFGIGDVLTTVVGIGVFGASESAPLAAAAIGGFGLASLVVYKVAFIAVAGGVYYVCPRPYRQGIPIGLVLVGVAVVAWNCVVLGSLY